MVVAASVRVLAGEEPPLILFFWSRPGPCSAPAESQDLGNQDPVGSPAEVSQTILATIIANQIPFKAGGLRDCLHVWKTITSDPFILDAVTHWRIFAGKPNRRTKSLYRRSATVVLDLFLVG